jgi:hypothetical protein
MIAKNDMMRVLLDACPSFAPQWQAFEDEWRSEADDLPLYLVLADFARHLIGMVERGDTAELPAVFRAIERLHVEGERYVREAATVGLLEDTYRTSTFTRTPPSRSSSAHTLAQCRSGGGTSHVGSGSAGSCSPTIRSTPDQRVHLTGFYDTEGPGR